MPKELVNVAIITYSISHFEVPLYRLLMHHNEIRIKVFYIKDIFDGQQFDSYYGQYIYWGENVLSGYKSQQIKDGKDLIKIVYGWKPDLVLINGFSWPGALKIIVTNFLRRRPQIQRGTFTFYVDPRRRTKSYLTRPLRKYILHMFQAHHYGGSYSKRVLEMAGIQKEAMFFLPYSVDSQYFIKKAADEKVHARELLDKLKWGSDTKIILYIGQHSWIKGADLAMEVFCHIQADFKESRFLIVGNGNMHSSMQETARKKLIPGTYHFAGFVPSKETVKYYLSCDIVLFTSRYETWARAVNEAMLCERVCVLNKYIAAAGGLVDDKNNGYVVDSLSIKDYISVLKEYFNLPEQIRSVMQNQARKKALEFSYEKHIDEFVHSIYYVKNIESNK
jgi:glycosyltransferase involved in cell wall biosynthesis